MLRAATVLHGERHAPELPIPVSAIERYAARYGMSGQFVGLVHAYDQAIMESRDGGTTPTETSKKVLQAQNPAARTAITGPA